MSSISTKIKNPNGLDVNPQPMSYESTPYRRSVYFVFSGILTLRATTVACSEFESQNYPAMHLLIQFAGLEKTPQLHWRFSTEDISYGHSPFKNTIVWF